MNTDARAIGRAGLHLRSAVATEWLPVLVALLVLYVPTFYNLAGTLWQQDEHAHGPIILLVILWLIWDKRQVLGSLAAESVSRSASVTGFSLLVIGVLFYAVGRSQDILMLEVGSLAPVLAGAMLAARGWAGLRAFWFPLLFIVFLVPLPGVLIDAMTVPLKQNVSQIAEQVLYALGYPVARTGVVINIAQYQLLVADACSGLNSMFSLPAIGLLYLYLMRYKSWVHNGLILASILPIAFCANIARVILLILITYYFGDAAAQGIAHGSAGILLFVTAMLMLIGFDAVLRSLSRVFNRRRQA